VPGLRLRATFGLRLFPRCVEGGRALDVGCGNGRFVAALQVCGWHAEGVEPDPRSAAIARRATGAPIHASLLEGRLREQSFDLITMNHVLEHLEDPLACLRACHRLLRPTGQLAVAVPNLRSLSHRAFGEHWHALDPPRHLVLYDRTSLASTLERAGFTVSSLETRFLRSNRAAFARSWSARFGRRPGRLAGFLWTCACVAAQAVAPDLGGEVMARSRKANVGADGAK
jgi:SAM-dependent methyltransferase